MPRPLNQWVCRLLGHPDKLSSDRDLLPAALVPLLALISSLAMPGPLGENMEKTDPERRELDEGNGS